MPGPASKPHESKEVTAGEQSEGPQTVPRMTPTVEQAKQGRQVLVRPFLTSEVHSRRC